MGKYVPQEFVPYVFNLLTTNKVKFRVTKKRVTKLGDYRPPNNATGYHVISVNFDLNPYSFLITTLHEFAHLNTFLKYGNKVNPHGKEWKLEFTLLLEPLIKNDSNLPMDVKKAILKSMNNPKASSCTDVNLARILNRYNSPSKYVLLEEIPVQGHFMFRNKEYKQIQKKRSRYLCESLENGRKYLINGIAEVISIAD